MKKLIFSVLICLYSTLLTRGQAAFSHEKITWVPFEWADPDTRDVMLVTARLDTLSYLFRWQLDTGSPYTYLEGGTFKKFQTKFPYLRPDDPAG